MPHTRSAFGHIAPIFLGLGLVALLAITGAAIWLVGRSQSYAGIVTEYQQDRAAATDVLLLLQAAETGQRGFLLTGEEDYLQPYTVARQRLPAALATLRTAAAADPPVRPAVTALLPVVTAKLDELATTIRLTRQGHPDQALALVRTNHGAALMEHAQALLARISQRLDVRLRGGSAALARSVWALLAVVLAGGVLIIAFALGAILVVRRSIREMERARGEAQRLNDELEERVQQRTAELARANEDLAQANEEVQRFAYIVSHDLRAPLVNVMGFTAELETALVPVREMVGAIESTAPELLTEAARLAVAEDFPESIGFIRSSTVRMDRLINAILKISREGRRALSPERVGMETLLRHLAGTVQHQLEEARAEIVVEAMPDLVSDRLALEQVFGNLLDNAVKYLDPGRPGRIVVRGRREGRFVVYEVEDNGRGIPEGDLERVFELFRRSGVQDRAGEGIGLAHVRAVVRRLGGTITCHSQPGRGSVFRVSLPAVPELQKEMVA